MTVIFEDRIAEGQLQFSSCTDNKYYNEKKDYDDDDKFWLKPVVFMFYIS